MDHQLIRLLRILNLPSSSVDDTKGFIGIKHDDLCYSIEKWINQVLLTFGEIIIVRQNQSLRDSGVDLLIDLPSSKKKYGIQVKSHYDISEKSFSRNIMAQITESKSHGVENLIILFAGDLTDRSQAEKVRGKISDISKLNERYVITIPPEKLWTLIDSLKLNLHPLKLVEMNFSNVFDIFQAVKESLDRQDRGINYSLNIFNKTQVEGEGIAINMKFRIPKGKEHLMDDLENLPLTNETLKLESDVLESIEVDGQDLLKYWGSEVKSELIVSPSKIIEQNHIVLKQLDKIIWDEKLDFEINPDHITNNLKLIHNIPNDPIIIELTFSNKTINVNFSIDLDRGDAIKLKDAIDRLSFYNSADKLILKRLKNDRSETIDFSSFALNIEEDIKNIIEAAFIIQTKTATKLSLKDNLPLRAEDYWNLLEVAENINNGYLSISRFNFTMNFPRFKVNEFIHKQESGKLIDDEITLKRDMSVNVMNKTIYLGPTTFKARNLRISDDIDSLKNKMKHSADEKFLINFEYAGSDPLKVEIDWLN
ncbi:MAG: hypothetical protein OEY49_12485 [Candidatus Heimdallarchaeota archaeon]|nr:hypothetical protein [Candidatus Heimdallarchaeota archaeon]